jgi:hypothetical protein
MFSTMRDTPSEIVNVRATEMQQLGPRVELKAYATGEKRTTLLRTRFLESREADRIARGGHPHLKHEPA